MYLRLYRTIKSRNCINKSLAELQVMKGLIQPHCSTAIEQGSYCVALTLIYQDLRCLLILTAIEF